jgi:hypothetical protein
MSTQIPAGFANVVIRSSPRTVSVCTSSPRCSVMRISSSAFGRAQTRL